MTKYTYPLNMTQAVTLLDRAKPEWADKIDLTRLNMASGHSCVLGQLYGNYFGGMAALFGKTETTPYNLDSIFGTHADERLWKTIIEIRRKSLREEVPPVEEQTVIVNPFNKAEISLLYDLVHKQFSGVGEEVELKQKLQRLFQTAKG
jgi:hypothetical protein